MKKPPDNVNMPQDADADALIELLDRLCASGSQHIYLNIGEETRVQTVSSTECSPQLGPCAIPNLGGEPEEEDEEF